MRIITPIEAFMEHSRSQPDAVAFQSNDVAFSFQLAAIQVGKFANYLEQRGIKSGMTVMTILPPRLDWYLILALNALGATSCSGGSQVPETLKFDWVVCTKLTPDYPTSKQILIDQMFLGAVGKASSREITPDTDPSHIVRLVLTSGTTGTSKAVPLTLASLDQRKRMNEQAGDNGTAMSLMGIGSLAGGNRVLYAAWNGRPFATPANRGDWASWLSLVQTVRPSRLGGSPAQLDAFFATAWNKRVRLDFLSQVTSAGAVFPAVLAERIRKVTRADLVSVYGSTEAGRVASKTVVTDSNPFELGKLDDEVQYQIVDDNGAELGVNEIGLLRVKTPAMSSSYHQDQQADATFYKDGWFYPGDEASVTADGRILLAGRTSEFINAGGVKINPTYVDQAISRLPNILDGASCGVENSSGVTQLVFAYVAPTDFDAKQALKTLKARLKAKHPYAAYRVSELPRNDNGKVVRHELSEMLMAAVPDATI